MTEERKRNRYSYIYNDLVQNERDFVGLVAYGIYKRDKIKHIQRLEAKLGKEPEPQELEEFNNQAADRLEQYRSLATLSVNRFIEDVLGQKIEELEQKDQSERKTFECGKNADLAARIDKLPPQSWLRGFGQGLAASVVYSLLLGAVITFLVNSQRGLAPFLAEILNPQQTVLVVPQQAVPPVIEKTP